MTREGAAPKAPRAGRVNPASGRRPRSTAAQQRRGVDTPEHGATMVKPSEPPALVRRAARACVRARACFRVRARACFRVRAGVRARVRVRAGVRARVRARVACNNAYPKDVTARL